MAILGSLLLPLGLFLCLGLLCSPASCINHNDNCMFFSKVIATTYSGIHANPNVYKSNTVYTVSVPVNNSISSVVLQAMDQHNSVIGSWQKADKYCNSSVLYHMKSPYSKLFKAKWVSPSSMNITAVKLQVFTVDFHNMARVSFKMLKRNGTTSDLTTKIFTIKPTTTPIPTHKLTTTPTHKLTTTPTHKLTTSPTHKLTTSPTHKLTTTPKLTTIRTTAKSSANRAFLSPMRDAIQILLVLLTSKLLF
ncbi:placenta-expressed transcript 1 protein [Physeter macrocephalus]|uniref:Placenta-expressed transcript 1 protein n=1 Tax=Physeter macrocephalus TaxID=9755 RepID=A0A2Y9FSQ3_PHYMC|nr:placenta-expressed transcript 1 protein [Physeter catodon]|eukprot:XP_007128352.2 placenta-expressed transcript 1 protein [Physeter catodon]